MSVNPKDLRAGQRIDLITDDGVEVRNLPLFERDNELWGGANGSNLFIRWEAGHLREGLTVTAIRSQPDPELWLDSDGYVYQQRNNGEGFVGTHLVGRVTRHATDLTDAQRCYGPLRRLTAGDPIGDDQ